MEVVYDDREGIRPGAMFSDADLLGVPIRMIVSPRNLKESCVEITTRDKSVKEMIPVERAVDFVKELREKLYAKIQEKVSK